MEQVPWRFSLWRIYSANSHRNLLHVRGYIVFRKFSKYNLLNRLILFLSFKVQLLHIVFNCFPSILVICKTLYAPPLSLAHKVQNNSFVRGLSITLTFILPLFLSFQSSLHLRKLANFAKHYHLIVQRLHFVLSSFFQ